MSVPVARIIRVVIGIILRIILPRLPRLHVARSQPLRIQHLFWHQAGDHMRAHFALLVRKKCFSDGRLSIGLKSEDHHRQPLPRHVFENISDNRSGIQEHRIAAFQRIIGIDRVIDPQRHHYGLHLPVDFQRQDQVHTGGLAANRSHVMENQIANAEEFIHLRLRRNTIKFQPRPAASFLIHSPDKVAGVHAGN